MNEYEYLQRLREMWSRSIMMWGQIMIPTGALIIAFFVFLADSINSWLLLLGWAIFTVCMIYWRRTAHHIDEQITGLYPRMIQLERENNWEIATRYCLDNLSSKSEKQLCHELGLSSKPIDYPSYENLTKGQKLNPYGLLLELYAKNRKNFLDKRGHLTQDFTVSGLILVFLIVTLWLII